MLVQKLFCRRVTLSHVAFGKVGTTPWPTFEPFVFVARGFGVAGVVSYVAPIDEGACWLQFENDDAAFGGTLSSSIC